MMSFLFILSCLVFFLHLVAVIQLFWGVRSMGDLRGVDCHVKNCGPLVSIIVPACNEEQGIEQGLQSILAQEYENIEIIVLNDRSTDATPDVLSRLKNSYPQITCINIEELPKGWLGKSHALATGAGYARGKYLLFTDADVIMEKTVVARAVRYVERHSVDHLSLVFKNISKGWLLNSLVVDTGTGLFLLFRPWLVKQKRRSQFIGIGAFNMVTKEAYEKVNGHDSIKMHPIDDIMLGKVMKRAGFRQDCLLATEMVTVPWYGSVGDMAKGLEKNLFSVMHYRLLLVPFALSVIVLLGIMPTLGLLSDSGAVQWVSLATVMVKLGTFYSSLKFLNLSVKFTPGVLVTPFLSLYIVLRSVYTTVKNNGIIWRGTHYSLKKLKASAPLFF